MLALLLVGCAARTAPAVFPTPMATAQEAPELHVEPEEGDCTSIEPYEPGEREPACVGLVVPPVTFAELLHAETLAEYHQRQSMRCQDGRTFDREHAQAVYGACWDGWQGCEARERQLRLWTPLGIAAGVGLAFIGGYELGRAIP
jgi:hypothetical protein